MPKLVVNGQTTQHAINVVVALVDPDTNQPVLREVQSKDFSSGLKDKVHARFRVGEFVPVVWKPNQFGDTLQIYDFLELTDQASLDRADATYPAWQILLGICTIGALFFALFWNVYTLGRYEPLDFDYGADGKYALGIGALIGILGIVGALVVEQSRRKRLVQKNEAALLKGEAVEYEVEVGWIRRWCFNLILAAGAILLCGLTSMMWAWTANALFDKSHPKDQLVEVKDMVMVTHSFILREYKLEFEIDGNEETFLTTPEQLARLEVPLAVAKVRNGAFGWPWVESIEPIPPPEQAD